ncbi:tRNA (adenosine(37)-N6)-threonylcarbamoyltransferase complex dimerization subunit type 1 TsaB [Aquisalimonas asiatica]|uniref:tRNA threonylcarbamoyladenosine biosynthesis protein TsaB n=1 Tax=Aquisalimonas asiatica TaxID=406100 RepID=A0A1H8R212_9GAMM|nr:tRNA (adenosine(37)-N6)-threonylcarbamoyltransferase complex dimerization subunit type 1 TsaB [Aquisalimonas asiatica]SEO60490.1 tRNA threonylcarbamoyladenosine biosynthesis protein TsaB [Aquisalimonas asiatica]
MNTNEPQADAPVLAVDAATDACTVALSAGGRIACRGGVMPREHAARLLGLVDEVLEELQVRVADLAGLAWCHGPGAFTGLRIAAGAVQGIAWGGRVPVIGVSTLAVMAQGAARRQGASRVCSALDARMGEVYWGCYARDDDTGLMHAVVEDRVCAPGDVVVPDGWGGFTAVGTGWSAYPEALAVRSGAPGATDDVTLPDARDLLPFAHHRIALGDTVAARDAVPVYLRDRVTG